MRYGEGGRVNEAHPRSNTWAYAHTWWVGQGRASYSVAPSTMGSNNINATYNNTTHVYPLGVGIDHPIASTTSQQPRWVAPGGCIRMGIQGTPIGGGLSPHTRHGGVPWA